MRLSPPGLSPGKPQLVEFSLGRDELAFWNIDMRNLVEPAHATVWIGPSSAEGERADFLIAMWPVLDNSFAHLPSPRLVRRMVPPVKVNEEGPVHSQRSREIETYRPCCDSRSWRTAPRGININTTARGYMATENTTALRNDPGRSSQDSRADPKKPLRRAEPCLWRVLVNNLGPFINAGATQNAITSRTW